MSDPLPRRVEYSAAILQRIKALAADAAKQGRLPSFRRALTTIDDALRTRPLPPSDNPDTFGDPAYTLKHLKLLVCHALVPPVTLHFAVSLEPQKIDAAVFIGVYRMRIELLAGG